MRTKSRREILALRLTTAEKQALEEFAQHKGVGYSDLMRERLSDILHDDGINNFNHWHKRYEHRRPNQGKLGETTQMVARQFTDEWLFTQ